MRIAAFLAVPALTLSLAVPALADAVKTPAAAVEELLAADRGFAASSGVTDLATGISAQFDAAVVMPVRGGGFASGKAAAVEALRANPALAASRASWDPVRGGISGDGQQGFTFGYLTLMDTAGTARHAKYLSYWVLRPEGWRVAAYKFAPRPAGEVPKTMFSPALPAKSIAASFDAAATERHRASLELAERSFSDEAQKIGLGAAFRKHGSADAVNMGSGPAFVVGADAIGDDVAGPDPKPGSPVTWAPDGGVLVASSGDLGVTWGMIRANGPVPEGRPAAVPFFTVWRRGGANDPWRYVAE